MRGKTGGNCCRSGSEDSEEHAAGECGDGSKRVPEILLLFGGSGLLHTSKRKKNDTRIFLEKQGFPPSIRVQKIRHWLQEGNLEVAVKVGPRRRARVAGEKCPDDRTHVPMCGITELFGFLEDAPELLAQSIRARTDGIGARDAIRPRDSFEEMERSRHAFFEAKLGDVRKIYGFLHVCRGMYVDSRRRNRILSTAFDMRSSG
jgi:hypothetical protein